MTRRLLIAAIFLLAGAVVNVAVAWGCAAWIRVEGWPLGLEVVSELVEVGYVVDPAFNGRGLRVNLVYREGLDFHLDLTVLSGWPFLAVAQPSWKSYEIGALPDPESRAALIEFVDSVLEDRDPDPQLAVSESARAEALSFSRALHGLSGFAATKVLARPRRVFVVQPLWPGFAVNTLFYAVVLWLLIGGPFALRRLIRMKRGRCVKCGYPIGESAVCSECGRELQVCMKVTT